MKLRPISELQREHKGRVVLLDVTQWRTCEGQMGRPWHADEGPDASGTDDPDQLRWCGFTHFVELTELEGFEREWIEQRFGSPITDAERRMLKEKYSAQAVAGDA